jgi:DNA-binding protein HU-beta
MNKQELIEAVAKKVQKYEVSKAAVKEIIDTAFEEIAKAIKKEKRFQMPGFGTFTVKTRKARTGRNPQTGEEIKIKASKTVGFKPAPSFKESL